MKKQENSGDYARYRHIYYWLKGLIHQPISWFINLNTEGIYEDIFIEEYIANEWGSNILQKDLDANFKRLLSDILIVYNSLPNAQNYNVNEKKLQKMLKTQGLFDKISAIIPELELAFKGLNYDIVNNQEIK